MHNRKSLRAILLASTVVFLAASIRPADAQTATNTAPAGSSQAPQPTSNSAQATSVAEIIVTATRQAQPLSKVPISITAFSQKQMDAQGIRSIGDIAALTPGLYFEKEAFFTGSNTEISIR
jgi:outer membrane receptor protein involved in Fe transport